MARKLKPGLYRVQEGAMISGVCTGLEACGKGTIGAWRLIFGVGSIFFFIPFIGYICMALLLPQVKTKREAAEANNVEGSAGANFFGASASTPDPEDELQKLSDMKAKGLIDEDEYKQLRKKALGL